MKIAIIAVLYLVFVMGYKLSHLAQIAFIIFLLYTFLPASFYKQVLEHPLFKKIYPGYEKLLNIEFLKENRIYLSYYVAILGVILYILFKVRRVYLGIAGFFGDVSSELGLLCDTRRRFMWPLLIPLYNPLFLIFFLLPLKMFLYKFGAVNANSTDENEMDKNGKKLSYKAFYIYYTISVFFLYMTMFKACRGIDEDITEASLVTEAPLITEAPPVTEAII